MSVLLTIFIDNLLPIFLAAGAGFALVKLIAVEPQSLSRVIFYIFSPCLVFNLLTQNQLSGEAIGQMVSFTLIHVAILGVLAWFLAARLKLKRRMIVALVLSVIMPNAGNFGLSLNQFAFGEEVLAFASLVFVVTGILANTIGVYIASLGRTNYKTALKGLLKIPTIYAVAIAAIFLQLNWQLPLPLERTSTVLGDAAIPAMLVLLGINLSTAEIKGQLKGLVLANGLRLVAAPFLALGVSAVMGLQGPARIAAITELSMPTAVMTAVLTTEFNAEPEFATAVIFTTTVLSPLTLTPLLAYLGA